MRIALRVGALYVNNRHVRVERRDNDNFTAGIRVDHAANVGVVALQVDRGRLVHRHKRQPGSPGLEARDHAKVRVFLPFEPPLFDGRAHSAQRTDTGVPHVREDHLTGAARGDHLLVDQVWRGARQGQSLATLADDLVAGGKGDQVGRTGQVNTIRVMYNLVNSFGE